MFEQYVVASLGGGLNITAPPLALRDDEWTYSDGFRPRDGTAESLSTHGAINGGTWLPVGQTFCGMVPDLTGGAGAANMLLVTTDALADVHLWRMTTGGFATELTVVGVRPQGNPATTLPTTAYMDGTQLIACGIPAGPYSIAAYTGSTTFARVAPVTNLRGQYLVAAASHFILGSTALFGGGGRTVQISDTLSSTVWDPSIANSADIVTLTGAGTITGMAPYRDGAVVLTADQVLYMSSSGSIPPFTIQIAEERGRDRLHSDLIVATPYGVVYEGPDDYYVVGGPGFGRKVFAYAKGLVDATLNDTRKLLWHRGIGCLVRSLFTEQLCYDYTTQAWWRRSFPVGVGAFHDVSHGESALGSAVASEHWLGSATGAIFKEDPASVFAGAFVDTKDFAFDSPMADDYVDRIKVDWEPLTNAATDAIQVLAWVRNDLAPGVLGSAGFVIAPTMTLLGTLTGGASELPVRLRGKFVRLRFRQSSGRVRIRGFSIRRERAGDRRT